MRKEFSRWAEETGRRENRLIFLTGDLGYGALENVRNALGSRFVNMGVSEQNMVSVAAGLARQRLLPICYSIAPFAVFRPYEQIRLDVALHNLPVKLVGNGGGYGYGIMGASHHALEDLAVLSCLPNFACIVPLCNSDVPSAADAFFAHAGPGYLRLGLGLWPESELGPLPAFAPIRSLVTTTACPKLTVVGLGPVLLSSLPWLKAQGDCEVFAVARLPLAELTDALRTSVQNSGRLLVLEEHTARGGLGEHLAARLASEGVSFRLHHLHARGYPSGRYGSQAFHQRESGLDFSSVQRAVKQLTES